MSLLSSISGPRDLDALSTEQLEQLAAEIRAFLIENVSRTGGHLGPNLGVVELTLAMHRVFDSPNDPMVFDTGHQSYVHKLLTGRQDFTGLRSRGGLAGYPQRSESPHDVVESSHASSSLSWADGVSRALTRTGRKDRHVDRCRRRRRPHRRHDVGGAQQHLRRQRPQSGHHRQRQRPVLRADDRRDGALSQPRAHCRHLPHPPSRLRLAVPQARSRGSRAFYRGVRGGTHGFLSRFTNNAALYSNLDIKYLGPVDGHDLPTLMETLELAKDFGAPVIVHAITEKGRGYQPARDDEADQFHAVGSHRSRSGRAVGSSTSTAWTDVFADELVAVGEDATEVIGITAAMLRPTGLLPFAQRFPDRVYDVGIAEQHAVASAAGLAFGGPAPRRRDLRDVHESRLRPGDDGCRAAPRRRDVRARPCRGHRAGRPESPRHLGPRDAADRSAHPHRRAPRRRAAPGGAARGGGGRRRSYGHPLPQGLGEPDASRSRATRATAWTSSCARTRRTS